MELFQLHSFLKVAEEGSVTRAADALYLTQPAVTQHIRSLENELGVMLFDRTGRGVRLTEAGEAFREYVRRCLAVLDEGRVVVSDLQEGTIGKLIIGAGVTTSIFHLPQWLQDFRDDYPEVDVVVRTGRSREVVQWVMEREIDLGLVTSPVDHPDLEVMGLFDEEIVLVTPPEHPLAQDKNTAQKLEAAPLILFPHGSGFRDYLDHTLAEAGVKAQVKMETDSVEAIKSFVMVGLGVSFLPESAVDAEVEAGLLKKVTVESLPRLARRTSIIYRGDRYLSTTARSFMQLLNDTTHHP